MTYEMGTNSEATAIASGLMVSAMIDLLVSKGVLSRDDITHALKNAFDQAGKLGGQGARLHAPAVIAGVMQKLPEGN